MNIISIQKLLVPFSQKCDLLGIGTAISGIANAASNAYQNERNIDLQRDLQSKSQEFTKSEREASQIYQTGEREAAQQFNKEMWNLNNQYNSPVEQVKRLQEAGINPAAVLGQNSSVAASPVQTNPQSGVQGAVVGAPMPAQQFNVGAGVNETIKALTEAAKSSSERKTIEQTRDEIVEQYRLQNQYQAETNALQHTFGYLERSKGLKKLDQEIQLDIAQALKYEADADYTKALEATEKIHAKVMDALARKTDAEADVARHEADNWWESYKARIDNLRTNTDYTRDKNQRENNLNEVEVIKGWAQLDLLHADKDLAQAKRDQAAALAEKTMREAGLIPVGSDAYKFRENFMKQLDEDLKSKEFENSFMGRVMKYLASPAASVGSAALMMARFL